MKTRALERVRLGPHDGDPERVARAHLGQREIADSCGRQHVGEPRFLPEDRPQIDGEALVGDGLVLAPGSRLGPEFEGRAWCPTPSALRAIAEAGAIVPPAPPLDVLITANHRRFSFELRKAEERAHIAGVYVQRLLIGMRLQADPTVIYGLGERYDGDIRTADLHTDGPYNTYTRAGLPPTPIALPGAASIHASAHPDIDGALYFVASGAGDGSHVFSKTYAEHSQAVSRYLQAMRRRAGSANP